MSEIYVGKMKKIGKLGEDDMQRKSAWLSEELMQAISIAQTVMKPIKQHDYCIEYATKLLAGSILYLNHRHKDLYYLDVKKAIEFTEKLYESGANLVEVVDLLKKEHPAHHIFQELGYHSEETRDTIIVTLLYNLEKYQREKLNPEREYFWFQ
ncbi:TRAG family protein [Bacillus cereus]|uniref:TRAG family protein n=1 Tax=Bacillus cereus TaxID=1396 RepID=UPI003A83B02B